MNTENLNVPKGMIDVVLDTDAYNEIDDQFAIAYMLGSKDKLNIKAFYAAPFHNENSNGPADGMERSYHEILKLLQLAGESYDVYRGSDRYLPDESTPVISEAAKDLAERAMNYSPEKPLYVVAIGAITNVASALLINPNIADRIVLVWLGGHGRDYHDTKEFNMMQDVAGARAVMKSDVAFVQLPCFGVVSAFALSDADIEKYFKNKNPLSHYLAVHTEEAVKKYRKSGAWSRVIWDVTAVAWLLNDDNRFMYSRKVSKRLPGYDHMYEDDLDGSLMTYVYYIKRDALLRDMIEKIAK